MIDQLQKPMLMQAKNVFLYFCFSTALLLAGCATDENADAEGSLDTTPLDTTSFELKTQGDTSTYRMQTVYEITPPDAKIEDEDITKIIFEFPVVQSTPGPNAALKMNTHIREHLLAEHSGELAFDSLGARMENFIEEYQSFIKDTELSIPWTYEMTSRVMLNTPHLFCLRLSEFTYTGGAHPNTHTVFLNFNARTGAALSLNDFLLPGYEAKLLVEAEKAFRQKNGLSPQANLREQGFEFSNGNFDFPNQFCLTKEGILFYFNAYEAGRPYALGPTKFIVPYNNIKSLIRKDGPLI